jgi:hypothetical protein
MFKLDHVIIAVNDLGQASRDYEKLGFTVLPGGTHANGASHNALIVFRDGSYIELLAPTGEPAQPGYADFSFLTQHGEGLVGFALRSDDLVVDVDAVQQRGLAMSAVTTGRRKRPDGLELQWRSARLAAGGLSPFLIQDITPRDWRVPNDEKAITHANTCVGIVALVLACEDCPTMQNRYEKLTNIPFNPELEPDEFAGGFGLDGCTLLLNSVKSPFGFPSSFGDAPIFMRVKVIDSAVQFAYRLSIFATTQNR